MTRLCILCAYELTPTELQSCAPCVSLVRLDLTQIRVCFALLPGLLGCPDGASLGAVMGGLSGEAALPGGDALVMLGPGGEFGEGDPSDPPAVAFELWQWQQDWAEIRGEAHQGHATGSRSVYAPPSVLVVQEGQPSPQGVIVSFSVPALVAWLGSRLSWAGSHHPAFDEFAGDMARIRGRLEVVTATDNAPERGETCPYCGGTLQREYGNQGRVDDWSCPRCHRAFNEAQYLLALRAALEGTAS